MEQAASGALSSLLAQMGFFGVLLLLIVGAGAWWLRATKDIRSEKEGVIERLQQENERLTALVSKYREAYYAARYPGSREDPFADRDEVDLP